MSVSITGASGFVGTSLSKRLLQIKLPFTSYARSHGDFGFPYKHISNYIEIEDGKTLIHLAENSNIAQAAKFGDAYIEQNTKLLEKLIPKFDRVIYGSSAVVYGDQLSHPRKTDEVLNPNSVYGKSKLACEQLVSNAGGLSFRFANIFGVGMAENNVLSDIIRQLNNDDVIKLRSLTPIRDFIPIESVLDCLVLSLNSDKSGVYNLGSGQGFSVEELANCIVKVANATHLKITTTNEDLSGHGTTKSHLILDIEDTCRDFAWLPHRDYPDIIANLLRTMGVL